MRTELWHKVKNYFTYIYGTERPCRTKIWTPLCILGFYLGRNPVSCPEYQLAHMYTHTHIHTHTHTHTPHIYACTNMHYELHSSCAGKGIFGQYPPACPCGQEKSASNRELSCQISKEINFSSAGAWNHARGETISRLASRKSLISFLIVTRQSRLFGLAAGSLCKLDRKKQDGGHLSKIENSFSMNHVICSNVSMLYNQRFSQYHCLKNDHL